MPTLADAHKSMPEISVKDVVVSGIIAPVIGSTLGTAIFLLSIIFYEVMSSRTDWILNYTLMYPLIFVVSLLGTIPGSIVVGVPAVYPLRNVIARHPARAALPVAFYSIAVPIILVTLTIDPNFKKLHYYLLILIYCPSCAMGFIITLRRIFLIERRRMLPWDAASERP